MAATTFAGTARFEIVRAIGAGGMGRVYEAIDRRDGGRVALKRLHATTPQGLLDIRREFRAVESVRHENLVVLLELIEEGAEAFFTMELVGGMPLLSYVGASLEGPGASGGR